MSSMPSTRRRTRAAALTAAAVLTLWSPAAAWASPEGRIQDVVSAPGSVAFVLSAEGLAEGQSIDPGSVRATIGGLEVQTNAQRIEEQASTSERTVMLVLDSSGSMAQSGKVEEAKAAAGTYLDSLPAEVEAGLIAFADEAEIKVAPTLDRAAVKSAVAGLSPKGATALNDAVLLSVDELGDTGSRNVVLLSDGEDESSEASAEEARKALARSGAVLDAVSLGAGGQRKQLAAFAAAGNGSLVTATDAETLTAAFESAARSVDSQLSVSAAVPELVEAGTAELVVEARVGEQAISDSAATLISPTQSPEIRKASVFGPVAVPESDPGIFDHSWFLVAVISMVFVSLATITSHALGAIDGNRTRGRVERRLDQVAYAGAPAPAAGTQTQTALGDGRMTRAAVSFADRVASSRDTSALARRLEEANVSLRPAEWVVIHALIVVLAAVLATLMGGFRPLITLGALIAAAAIPWLYLDYKATRRRSEFHAALPDSLQMMAGSLSAGYSLPQAIDAVARETGAVFGQELNRALLESRLGLPIEDSLEAAAQRMRSVEFHWVVMAIRTNRQIGGNLAEVLVNVSKTLRERERLRRQVRTLSAEGKLSAWIIGALPILMLAFLVVFRPEFVAPLFTTVIGWVMLAAGAVAYVLGIIWMRNLVNMEV